MMKAIPIRGRTYAAETAMIVKAVEV